MNVSKKQWLLIHILLLSVLGLAANQYIHIKNQKNTVTFLDIGQGDAILIQTKEDKNILIDTGPDGVVVDRLSEKLNFFNPTIDLFILSHPDLDHYGGIMDILQKYDVKKIMITGIASSSDIYVTFLDKVQEENIPIIYPTSNEDWQISPNLILDILYPFNNQNLIGQAVKSKNNTSISFTIRNHKGEPLLLSTGDAEEDQEKELLLSAQDFSAPRFALGHHGSKTSNNPNLLKAINADTFIISAGKDNPFGHPHQEVLERLNGKEILNTADIGNIEFVLE